MLQLDNPLLVQLTHAETGLELLETVLRYVATAGESVGEQVIEKTVIATFAEEGSEIMPTLAQKWIEQGIEQGLRDSILDLLDVRFGVFSAEIRTQLANINDTARLRNLHR